MDKVVIYTSYLYRIGGIETWVYNFIDLMSDKYDITLMALNIPPAMKQRLSKKIRVCGPEMIDCDTLIMLRIMEEPPRTIKYNKMIRVCHACKVRPEWYINQDYDYLINVSKASKKSFGEDAKKGKVIHNMLIKSDKKALMIVSATRIPAPDKGKNADRILKLANMLNAAGINFLWFNFSDNDLPNAPKNFYNVGTSEEIQPFIAKADYLCQLSDQEGFCYSVLEALINGTAVICTPFETTKELGVKDGVNGYIVPFDMDFDVRKLLKVPEFDYEYDNAPLIEEWDKILQAKPKRKAKKGNFKVFITRDYFDTDLQRGVRAGETLEVSRDRAKKIIGIGYGRETV